MFKIMIHKPTMAKGTWMFYTEAVPVYDDDDETIIGQQVQVVETDNYEELTETYLNLLNKYTADSIKIVEDLDVQLIANVTNN